MKINSVTAMFLAGALPACLPGTCRPVQLADVVEGIHIKAGSALSALVQLGKEKGICFGIETTDTDMLNSPVSLEAENDTLGWVIHKVLPQQRQYDVSVSDAVVLVRGIGSRVVRPQLDMILPEFTIGPVTVRHASFVLHFFLVGIADPALQGFAGDFSDRFPDDKVLLDEHGRSVREILTKIVSRSRSGAWIAGPCPMAELGNSGLGCWEVLDYRDESNVLANDIGAFVAEQKRRLESSGTVPAKP